MKKFFVTALAAVVIAGSSFAAPGNVNDEMVQHLSTEFKDATNIQWKTTDAYTEADFTWNKQSLQAFYDINGNYLGTGKNISMTVLPLNAQQTLQNRYSDYKATSAIQFQDSDNGVNYYVAMESPKAAVILNITPSGYVSVFKKTHK